MQPIPCAHCGINYMRQTPDPEVPKLCNSCLLREERRVPTKKDYMITIDIVIRCPVDIQAEIEEYCINNGCDFSKYFLKLHDTFKHKINTNTSIEEALQINEEGKEKSTEILKQAFSKNDNILPTSNELRKNKKIVDKKSRFV